MGHRAAVNVVDFDEKYIVSASGDRTIKVSTSLTSQALSGLVKYSIMGAALNAPLESSSLKKLSLVLKCLHAEDMDDKNSNSQGNRV